ncbi:hypothetical protein CGCTS75_v007522 [Colletotrichum tropicale]|nr:hypothetical protein CGCTS75_v007522 [Colletotrichum tropicale]
MSGSKYGASSSRHQQSSYSMSSNTGGRTSSSSSSQTRYTSYASSSSPSDRFYATGQPTGRSSQSMAGQMAAWDQQWSSASSGSRR